MGTTPKSLQNTLIVHCKKKTKNQQKTYISRKLKNTFLLFTQENKRNIVRFKGYSEYGKCKVCAKFMYGNLTDLAIYRVIS